MTRGLLKLAMAAAALASLPAAADAAVTYAFTADSSFTGDDRTYSGGFVLTLNDYITADKTVPAAAFTSCAASASDGVAATCSAQRFFVAGSGDIVGFSFGTADGGLYSYNYFFDTGAFASNGTYQTGAIASENRGSLTVSGFAEPTTGGVPEPSSWALMLLGFGALGATLRRRQLQPA